MKLHILGDVLSIITVAKDVTKNAELQERHQECGASGLRVFGVVLMQKRIKEIADLHNNHFCSAEVTFSKSSKLLKAGRVIITNNVTRASTRQLYLPLQT